MSGENMKIRIYGGAEEKYILILGKDTIFLWSDQQPIVSPYEKSTNTICEL